MHSCSGDGRGSAERMRELAPGQRQLPACDFLQRPSWQAMMADKLHAQYVVRLSRWSIMVAADQ